LRSIARDRFWLTSLFSLKRQEFMTEVCRKTKVLIADDEKIIADTLALILNRDGFDARAVYTCQKALEMAPGFQPDMLISDVVMTGIDGSNGIDAAIKMRTLLPKIRVFLLSGQIPTAEMLAKSKAGNLDFEILAKPLHPRDLIARLKSIPSTSTRPDNLQPAIT
jgi:DNA-binding response OmpR family regulator